MKKKRPYCLAPILHDRLVLLSSLRCTCPRRLAVKCHRHTPLLAAAAAASDHPAMARPAATAAAPKAPPPKHLIALAVVAILGLVLVADFLWASSSPAAPAWSSRIDLPGRPAALVPPSGKKVMLLVPISQRAHTLFDCCLRCLLVFCVVVRSRARLVRSGWN